MKESTHMANMAKVTSQIRPRPMKIFAPGFGAGSVGGYTIMRIDPNRGGRRQQGQGKGLARRRAIG
jgi:hypothetical protein